MNKRIRASITLPQECLDYVDGYVKDGTFKDRSHGIQRIILEVMKREKEENK